MIDELYGRYDSHKLDNVDAMDANSGGPPGPLGLTIP
jgi:hypothetical protein